MKHIQHRNDGIAGILFLLLAISIFAAGCSDFLDEDEYFNDADMDTAVELACDTPEDCADWGDELANQLISKYGSFTLWDEYTEDEYEAWFDEDESALEEEQIIAEYELDGDMLIPYDSDDVEAVHEQLWHEFAAIIPANQRESITVFAVFEHEDTMAYVQQNEDDIETWTLALNIGEIDGTMSRNEAINTKIHELGHILTLNADQVDAYAEEQDCSTYYVDEGCAYEGSYIYEFYKQFGEASEADFGEENYVNDYAATNTMEDIAESWAYFVLSERPEGYTAAEQKVLFFERFDELVMLRAELLARVTSWLESDIE